MISALDLATLIAETLDPRDEIAVADVTPAPEGAGRVHVTTQGGGTFLVVVTET